MKNKVIRLLVIVVTILIVVDQTTKLLVSNKLVNGSIGNEKFGLEITSNTGMAFDLMMEVMAKNIVLTIFILLIIITFIKINQKELILKTALALSFAISGGISNLIDRIFRGGVFDFIKFYNITFNLADIFVVLGWILLVVFLIDYSRKNQRCRILRNTVRILGIDIDNIDIEDAGNITKI